MDTDHDGELSIQEIKAAYNHNKLQGVGLSLSKEDLDHMFKQIDVDNSGSINFSGKIRFLENNIYRISHGYNHQQTKYIK